MKPHDDRHCPIASTHDKYKEAIYFLSRCMGAYHDPDEFRFNLNAFIQAFRNITFILQSEDNKPACFEEWYARKQEEMRSEDLMGGLVTARNIVVKRSMLETRSTIQAGVFRGRNMKLAFQHEISPFTPTLCILGQCIKTMTGLMIDEGDSSIGEQLGVERKWVVERVGDGEILSLCIRAMRYMGKLLEEAHGLYGIEYAPEDLSKVDMKRITVLLESDVDPALPKKWGW